MAPSVSGSVSSARSGIQTTSDGSSYIPSSTRADGSTRKEIRVRPGYRPPEDVETYKNRSAEAWKNRGNGGVPGTEIVTSEANKEEAGIAKSKNAKRRETAKKKAKENEEKVEKENTAMEKPQTAEGEDDAVLNSNRLAELNINTASTATDALRFGKDTQAAFSDAIAEVDRQKKIRNILKKLRAVRDLKAKKEAGEKVSHDQLLKIGKESELLRDLQKLGHDEGLGENDGTEADAGESNVDAQGRANG